MRRDDRPVGDAGTDRARAGAGRAATEAPAHGAPPADPADPQPVTDPAAADPAVEPGAVRLLGPAEVRTLAAELDLRPTKRLGQNFVHDPNTVRRIVRSAGLAADDVVLEVGPGLGSLTLGLLEAVAAVTAVEIDPTLAARLPATVRDRAPCCRFGASPRPAPAPGCRSASCA